MSGVIELVNGSAAYIPITPRDNTNGSLKTSALTLTAAYVQIANGTITTATSPTLTHKGNGVHVLYIAAANLGTNGNGTITAVIADCFAVEIPIRVVTELTNTAATRLTSTRAGYIDAINSLNNLSAAEVNAQVDIALADYDAPTKAEMDSAFASLNDLSAAEVNAEVDTALADYDGPTKTEMDVAFAALNDLSAAEVNAEVDTALSDYDPPTKAEMDAAFIDIKGATWNGSTDTLEQIRDNLISAAAVNAEVDTALSDYDGPTKAEMDAAFGALNDLSAAQVNTEVDTALADYDAPTKAEMDSAFTQIKGATWSSSTDTLEQIRDNLGGSAPTAADIADAVWDEATVDHTTAGSFGKALSDALANTTTILARIGAFTGTGVNTILGFFLAVMGKTATKPSDVDNDFTPASESLEAILDRGNSAWRNITAVPSSASSGQTFFNQRSTVREIFQNDDHVLAVGSALEFNGPWTGITPTHIGNLTAIKLTATLGNNKIEIVKTTGIADWVVSDGSATDPQIIIEIPSASNNQPAGTYTYDFQLTIDVDGTEYVRTVESGTLVVKEDQTDPN